MYNLIRNIDFDIVRGNHKKNMLKKLYIEWLILKQPQIMSVDTYFTDAIFIANHPELNLDIMEILDDFDDGIIKYHSALINHFDKKGYDENNSANKAKDYIYKLILLKEFLDDYECLNTE